MAAAAALVVAAAIAAGCGGGNPQLGFSPKSGTPAASPQTQISLRGVEVSGIRDLSVAGSRSGPHPGRLVPFPQGDGASFMPDNPFEAGETVDVRLKVDGKTRRLRFTIAQPATANLEAGPPGRPTKPGQVASFHHGLTSTLQMSP